MSLYPPLVAASATYASALVLIEELQSIGSWSGNERAKSLVASLRALVPSGIYRHYKSTPEAEKLYAVLGVAESSEDDREWVVVYAALYEPHKGKLAYRPTIREDCGFFVPVEKDEYEGPRFTLVEELPPREVLSLIF